MIMRNYCAGGGREERLMNDLFITYLSMSVSGMILILTLLILKRIYKNKLSKGWQYYIWLIVLARLIFPFSTEASLIGKSFTDINEHIVAPVATAYYGNGEGNYKEYDETSNQAVTEETAASKKALPVEVEETDKLNIWIIWLVIALVLLIRKITLYQSFVKYVRAGSREVNAIERLEQFGQIIEEQKIKSGIELYTNCLVSSPLLIGFWKPCIILPTTDISEADFRYTILHELTHYRRGDMFYKWLTQAVICLHWFNPFVYLMGREIAKACELSCDEAVISKLNVQQKRSYGDTLLNAVKTEGSYKDSVISVTLCESKKLLSERLGAIMSYKKQSKTIIFLSITAVFLFLCSSIYIGAYPIQSRVGINKAPESLSAHTAKADTYTQLDKPNVDIMIDDFAAVNLVLTSDNEITVDYDDALYSADVANENGDWKVYIAYTGKYSKYPSATLYIPAIAYSNVNIQANQATVYFNSVFQRADNINAYMELCSIFYTVPEGFLGKLKADMPDSYLELYSDDGYKDCSITIANCESFGKLDNSFKKQGNSLIYSNGISNGIIDIDFSHGGYASVFSDSLNKASKLIPTEEKAESSSENIEEYTADSSGLVDISVNLDTIKSGDEICIAEIPDLSNAHKIVYDVQFESKGALYIGIRAKNESKSRTKSWYNYVEVGEGNLYWKNEDLGDYSSIGYKTGYTGSYYVYVGSRNGDCTDIDGSISIEYNK